MRNRNSFLAAGIFILAICFFGCGYHASNSNQTPNSSADVQEIRVAAAANLKYVLEQISSDFERANPRVKVTITYGSSGNFFSQMQQSAPFDLFLSADEFYPNELVAKGLAERESLCIYAMGKLVVWTSNSLQVDFAKRGLATLEENQFRKIAIANPRHAPYGKAAEQALKRSKIYEAIQARLVLGNNIEQAATFAQTGSADAGLVAKSLAIAPPMKDAGKYWEVLDNLYDPLRQAGVILKSTKNKTTAAKFLEYLQSKDSQANFQKFGYSVP